MIVLIALLRAYHSALASGNAPRAVAGQAEHNGRRLVARQGNNSYIFPGIGLGAIASGATRITDEMLMNAALALAECVNNSDLEQGSLYPALPRIREVSAHIAARVAHVAYRRGLASGEIPDDMPAHIKSHMYEPRYHSYA
jgi:malate dehydrogenase (oxaloacetate-decarboxylating)(NADP+)